MSWSRWRCTRQSSAFNAGDVDALMTLYEPDARMVRDDASVAVGLDEIRAVWADLVALGVRVRMVTRYAVESGDIALPRTTGRSNSRATPWPPGRRRKSPDYRVTARGAM
jgi:ketosteroid isomerase-like protein